MIRGSLSRGLPGLALTWEGREKARKLSFPTIRAMESVSLYSGLSSRAGASADGRAALRLLALRGVTRNERGR